jgi:hypothetical protein
MISRLSELILKDFWLKLFSLALAILIWFTIFQAIQQQGSPVTGFTPNLKKRTFYNLLVTPVSSSSDVHNFKLSPNEVQVTVLGEAKLLEGLQAEGIKARVDLSGLESEGDLRLHIEVATPPGLTCVDVEPAQVQVIPPPKSPVPAH